MYDKTHLCERGDFMKLFLVIIFCILILFIYCALKTAHDCDNDNSNKIGNDYK